MHILIQTVKSITGYALAIITYATVSAFFLLLYIHIKHFLKFKNV